MLALILNNLTWTQSDGRFKFSNLKNLIHYKLALKDSNTDSKDLSISLKDELYLLGMISYLMTYFVSKRSKNTKSDIHSNNFHSSVQVQVIESIIPT